MMTYIIWTVFIIIFVGLMVFVGRRVYSMHLEKKFESDWKEKRSHFLSSASKGASDSRNADFVRFFLHNEDRTLKDRELSEALLKLLISSKQFVPAQKILTALLLKDSRNATLKNFELELILARESTDERSLNLLLDACIKAPENTDLRGKYIELQIKAPNPSVNALNYISDLPEKELDKKAIKFVSEQFERRKVFNGTSLGFFKKMAMIDKKNARWHYTIGRCFHTSGKISEAIEAYQYALSIDPEYAAAQTMLDSVRSSKFEASGNYLDENAEKRENAKNSFLQALRSSITTLKQDQTEIPKRKFEPDELPSYLDNPIVKPAPQEKPVSEPKPVSIEKPPVSPSKVYNSLSVDCSDMTLESPGSQSRSRVVKLGDFEIKLPARYNSLSEIGRGGMGIVIKAFDENLKRWVAIKTLRKDLEKSETELCQRFIRESRIMASLSHPAIPRVFDLSVVPPYYLSFEFLEGNNLRKIIGDEAQRNAISFEHMISIAIEISDGLNYAMENEILHRDIKPENLLIEKTGHAKILDFGLALREGQENMTKTGIVIGTPWYISPERLQGNVANVLSEIFAFGVTMYEMFSGQRPFQGDNLFVVLTTDPTPLSGFIENPNPELEALLLECVNRNPLNRPQAFSHVRDNLLKIKSSLQTPRE
ncbi:MAG: protein kinase [Candidatus Riflebacteria bacterium]|nr:protein kinase [Candidatus Riflebacteria bacterium]